MTKLQQLEFNFNEQPFQQLDMKYADTEAGNRDRFVERNKNSRYMTVKVVCISL